MASRNHPRPVDPRTYRTLYKELLNRSGRPFFPDVGWRDGLFGFAIVASIIVLAVVFHAPELSQPPNPAIIRGASAGLVPASVLRGAVDTRKTSKLVV